MELVNVSTSSNTLIYGGEIMLLEEDIELTNAACTTTEERPTSVHPTFLLSFRNLTYSVSVKINRK